MGTLSGTVMAVRTAGVGCPPATAAPSAAAACAEASREVGAPGTGTFGEESGKNPRPCLPARGGADPPESTRARRPGTAVDDHRSPARVGRPPGALGQEGRHGAAQVVDRKST